MSDQWSSFISLVTQKCGGGPFVNWEKVFSGDLSPENPTVAEMLPGKFFLYAGRINEQHGEPGVGKSNVLYALIMSELKAGRCVMMIDPEDTAPGVARRMVSFGAKQEWFSRFLYCQNPTNKDYETLHSVAREVKPALVAIDGVAESLAAAGKNEDSAQEFLEWKQAIVRPFADTGAAVLLSDHVTKSQDGRGRYPRGSGAKLAGYDGISYEVTSRGYSRETAGQIDLKISKDRLGGIGQMGDVVLCIKLTPQGDGKTLLECQAGERTAGDPWRPTKAMRKLVEILKSKPDASVTYLREQAGFKHELVDKAIRALEEGGYLEVTSCGPGRPKRFKILMDYSAPTEA